MKPENWISIVVATWTAIALFVGPRIAVKLSLRQFRSQKWWERQQAAYTEMLEDLSVVFSYHVNLMDTIETGSKYNRTPQVTERVSLARDRLERQSATGAYMISDKTAEALIKYQRQSYIADHCCPN